MARAGGLVVGLDVGGTKVLGRVLRPERATEVVAERRVPTPQRGAPLVDTLAEVVADLGRAPEVVAGGGLVALGVGLPGLVERGGGLRFAPNLQVEASAVGEQLTRRCGLPVVVDNDANCALVCEHRLGAARGHDDVVLVTLGTGIGGGLLTGGELWRGAHGFAGEPGHIVVDPGGPRCPCGRRGCWERYASGSGLERTAREAAAAGRAAGVLARAGGSVEAVEGEHVSAAAVDGDPEALALLEDLARWLALGVANLVTLLDPEVVVVGGGLASLDELLLVPARAALEGLAVGGRARPAPPLVRAQLGPEAGAIGAGLLAARQ